MSDIGFVAALAKALLAIAWADGELHREEEITTKEVIGLLPSLSAHEWATIELYLVSPIGSAERADLFSRLLQRIRNRNDKHVALEAVDAMLAAGSIAGSGKEPVAHELRNAIEALDVSPLSRIVRAVSGTVQPPPPRESGLELWRSNPVFYVYQVRGHAARDGVPASTVENAALAAAIMAQVVRVTPTTAEQERPILTQALRTDWGVPSPQVDELASAALSIIQREIDYHRVARELARRTPESQRMALLDTLFTIANAAEQVSPAEIDEIRIVAERLNLSRQQFIQAKVKIPAADRGGL